MQALQPEFQADVDFFEIQANTREARSVLARLGVPIDHGLVALNRQGQVIWWSYGHDLTLEKLRAVLRQAIQ